ncbi:MAG TPA: GAF domain-containing protein [Roseiflexaceae bacterium]|nr:GAF domain-containing protein [Roseiflexaceae bacterium]
MGEQRPLRILLIDDNPRDRVLAARELRRTFTDAQIIEIIDAVGLAEAVAMDDFDVVVTDYQLHWGDGMAVLAAVKTRRSDCPVIMFTASGSQELAVAAMQSGLDDYVVKSSQHFVRLPIAVERALERMEQRRVATRLDAERNALLIRSQEAERRATFLAEASALLTASLDYQITLGHLAELVVGSLADWCLIDMLDEDGELDRLAVAHHDPACAGLAARLRNYPPHWFRTENPIGEALRDRRSVRLDAISPEQIEASALDPEHLQLLRELRPHTAVLVPLLARERVLGIITLVLSAPERAYGPQDVQLAEALAHRAALAIDNARLYKTEQQVRRQAERTAARLSRLQLVATALAGAVTVDEVAAVVIEQGVAAVEANAGSLVLFDQHSGQLEVIRAVGYSDEVLRRWQRFPLSAGTPLSDAVRERRMVLLSNEEERTQRYPHLHGERAINKANAWAAIPLLAGGQAVGGLCLNFGSARAFSAEERTFMDTLAQQCAQAIVRARLYSAEQTARAASGAASDRAAFLAEATALLTSSLEYDTTLEHLARLAVPRLADWCIIDVQEPDGALHPMAIAHLQPERVALVQELRLRYPLDTLPEHPVARVIQTGQTLISPEDPTAPLALRGVDAGHTALLETLEVRSQMVVPLIARGVTLGALSFVSAQHDRYGPDELALAEELARRAELALDNARLYRAAQQAIQIRDQFLSIASHELKTPLTSIFGNVQLLQRRLTREGAVGERDTRTLRAVVEQTDRLRKLVDALLDISRLQAGQLSVARDLVDLGVLVRQVVAEYQPTLEQHTLTCQTPASSLLVRGDALRLEQVLHNLLQNAVKYSPQGGPVHVRAEVRNGYARVHVSDEGIGIPTAALSRIFQRFYRAANADTRHISGMGVGLYVVSEIIALHGGEVSVESTEGRGSTFTISLPLID